MRVRQQFIIFIAVGFLSAVVDIATMQGLIYLGGHYGMAASVGFAVGLLVNYLCHSRVTFRAAGSVASMARFGAVVFINYLITIAFVFASQRLVGGALSGKVASLPVVALNGFLLSRYWVFK